MQLSTAMMKQFNLENNAFWGKTITKVIQTYKIQTGRPASRLRFTNILFCNLFLVQEHEDR